MSLFSRRNFMSLIALGSLSTMGRSASAANPASHDSKENGKEDEHSFDCVVLGAGAAGLITAISAHDAGAKTVVLEKCDRPDGNSIYAMGGINACGTKLQKSLDVKDSPEEFYKDMMKISSGRADPQLTKVYVDHIAEDCDWLQEKLNVPFVGVLNFAWPILQRSVKVDDKNKIGGAVFVQTLLEEAKKRGIPVLYEHKAVELLTNPKGEVVGVIAQTPNDKITFKAKGGVAICTGGFSANPEMTGMYIGEWASRLALRGSHSTTGENISLTKPLFAKLVNMGHFHCGPIASDTHTNPQAILNSGYGIVVNLEGKRFLDEAHTYVQKAKECAQLTPENKAWVIMDSQWDALDKTLQKYQRMNATYFVADSLNELCELAGLPFEKVQEEVKAYNSAVKDGKLQELPVPCGYKKPHEIQQGKLYAFYFEGGMTTTFGGPQIDTRARVINLEGKPISGLYAVGNAAGGLLHKDYIGGTLLGACAVFGRIAGKDIAQRAQSNKA